jgi:hypothetical protein
MCSCSDVQPAQQQGFRSHVSPDACTAKVSAEEPTSNTRALDDLLERDVDEVVDDHAGGYFLRRKQSLEHRSALGETLAQGTLSHAPLRSLASHDGGLWLLFLARTAATSVFGTTLPLGRPGSLQVVRLSPEGKVLATTTLEAAPDPVYPSNLPLSLLDGAASTSAELLLSLSVLGELSCAGQRLTTGPSTLVVKLDGDARVRWAVPGLYAKAVTLFADGSSAMASQVLQEPLTVQRLDQTGARGTAQEFPVIIDSAVLHGTADGGLVLAGTLRDDLRLAQVNEPENGSTDLFVLGLDAALALRFAKRYGGPGNETIESAQLDDAGHLWLSGRFEYETSFGESLLHAHAPETGDASWNDGYIVELDSDGDAVRSVALGGGQSDNCLAVLASAEESVLALVRSDAGASPARSDLARVPLSPTSFQSRKAQPPELSGVFPNVNFANTLSVVDDLLAVGSQNAVDVFRRRHGVYQHLDRVEIEWPRPFALTRDHLYVGTSAGVSAYALDDIGLHASTELLLDETQTARALASDGKHLFVGGSYELRIHALPGLELLQTLSSPGEALKVADDRLLAGAPNHSGPRPASGAVTLFVREHGHFVQRQVLTASDAAQPGPDWPRQCSGDACWGGSPMLGERFGISLALAGRLLAVNTDTPRAYLFEYEDGRFIERVRVHETEIDGIAQDYTQRWAIALDAGRIALANRNAALGPLHGVGVVYLLTPSTTGLTLEATFLPKWPERDGAYGAALGFDGDRLLIGAPGEGRGALTRLDLCASASER